MFEIGIIVIIFRIFYTLYRDDYKSMDIQIKSKYGVIT